MSKSSEEIGDDLDLRVAEELFGLSKAAIKEWPWGVPAFSSNRRWSADVIGKMLVHPARELFDVELERSAQHWGWKKTRADEGASVLVLVLTPDEICHAALRAIREYGSVKQT